jgi:hypothetical protein
MNLTFDFSLVLTSIILGLGVTSLLSNLASWIENRKRITFHWPHLVWSAIIGTGLFQYWWASWNMQRDFKWTIASYAIYSAYPSLLYIICELLFPKLDSDGSVNLEAHFSENRRWLFGLATLLPLDMFIHERLVFPGKDIVNAKNVFRLAWFVMFMILAMTKNKFVHIVSAVIILLTLMAFTYVFRATY